MTVRERFLDYMRFRPVDRAPLMEIGYWPETLDRWRGEGMPAWITDVHRLEDYLRLDRSWNCNWLPIDDRVYPPFTTAILEETATHIVLRDGAGVVQRQSKTSRSIPQFIRFPVENEEDYERLLPRLEGGDPDRYAAGFDEEVRGRRERGEILGVSFAAFFGFPRELMGLENWCVAFHDYPRLVRRIIADRVEFGKRLYRRALDAGAVDFVQFWEDMAYRSGSLISPRLVREIMQPAYEEMVAFFRDAGVALMMVDSDGNIDDLFPIFLDAGVDGMHPCERAAGTDPIELRRRHPGCRLIGGMDKRAIASGPDGVDAELNRLKPILREGGFIPSLDHFVPPDVSWDTYRYYVERRRELGFGNTMLVIGAD